MAFLAGFCMNDIHQIGPSPLLPFRADFVQSHPEWHLAESREGPGYEQGAPLDFTFDGVRDLARLRHA